MLCLHMYKYVNNLNWNNTECFKMKLPFSTQISDFELLGELCSYFIHMYMYVYVMNILCS